MSQGTCMFAKHIVSKQRNDYAKLACNQHGMMRFQMLRPQRFKSQFRERFKKRMS